MKHVKAQIDRGAKFACRRHGAARSRGAHGFGRADSKDSKLGSSVKAKLTMTMTEQVRSTIFRW